jgi:hypothetical protein
LQKLIEIRFLLSTVLTLSFLTQMQNNSSPIFIYQNAKSSDRKVTNNFTTLLLGKLMVVDKLTDLI